MYNLVKKKYPSVVVKGKDLFDASLFRDAESTKLFYTFMGELSLLCNKARVTKTHGFIEFLETRGTLLRWYTQNIDGLEDRALAMRSQDPKPLENDLKKVSKLPKIIQLHGNLQNVKCTLCSAQLPIAVEHTATFIKGQAPACPACTDIALMRSALGKRAVSVGSLRPDVVLYNEHHSKGVIFSWLKT